MRAPILGVAALGLLASACGGIAKNAAYMEQPVSSQQAKAATPTAATGATSVASARTTVKLAHNAKLGTILVAPNGMVVYHLSTEASGHIHCVGGCTAVWPPLELPTGVTKPVAGPGLTGTLGVTKRPSGPLQVTYNGMPLYLYAGDAKPGQAAGQGLVQDGGTWSVVSPAGG